MAFGFGKKKNPEVKSNSDVPRKRNWRGDALTENTEGFRDLYWP